MIEYLCKKLSPIRKASKYLKVNSERALCKSQPNSEVKNLCDSLKTLLISFSFMSPLTSEDIL